MKKLNEVKARQLNARCERIKPATKNQSANLIYRDNPESTKLIGRDDPACSLKINSNKKEK